MTPQEIGTNLMISFGDGEKLVVEVKENRQKGFMAEVLEVVQYGQTETGVGSMRYFKYNSSDPNRSVSIREAVTAPCGTTFPENINEEMFKLIKLQLRGTIAKPLALPQENKNMGNVFQNVSASLKRFFNADQKTQYKAGFLNQDLSLTSKGLSYLFIILADKYNAELTAAATEVLADQKDAE